MPVTQRLLGVDGARRAEVRCSVAGSNATHRVIPLVSRSAACCLMKQKFAEKSRRHRNRSSEQKWAGREGKRGEEVERQKRQPGREGGGGAKE